MCRLLVFLEFVLGLDVHRSQQAQLRGECGCSAVGARGLLGQGLLLLGGLVPNGFRLGDLMEDLLFLCIGNRGGTSFEAKKTGTVANRHPLQAGLTGAQLLQLRFGSPKVGSGGLEQHGQLLRALLVLCASNRGEGT